MRHKRRTTERERRARKGIMRELGRVSLLRWPTPARNDPSAVQHAIAVGDHSHERACDTKTRFSTFDKAEFARLDIQRRSGRVFESYACPFCKSFHLSSLKRDREPPPVVVPPGFRFPTRSPHLSTPIRRQG